MAETVTRRPYVREVPRVRWFFRHPRYVRYMAREVTCLFIGAYTLLMVAGLQRLSEGRASWEAFLEMLRSPWSVVFHGLVLGFSLYHTVTWFNLTPKALPIQVGEAFVPDWAIAGAHYAAWILLSLFLLNLAGAY